MVLSRAVLQSTRRSFVFFYCFYCFFYPASYFSSDAVYSLSKICHCRMICVENYRTNIVNISGVAQKVAAVVSAVMLSTMEHGLECVGDK